MKQKKKLKELTIKDNFMFGAVMADEKNCREFLELTLGFPIDFVRQLQNSVELVKENREMEERFMILEEMLNDERTEGKAEGKAEDIIELLMDRGTVSEDLRDRIMHETDLLLLKKWLKLAARADSVEQFAKEIF